MTRFVSDQLLRVPEWVLYLNNRLSFETAHVDDDLFDSDSSADYTAHTVNGSASWTINRGLLSAVFEDQVGADAAVFIKAITSASAPMTIETRMSMFMPTQDFPQVGICFTDGAVDDNENIAFLNLIGVDTDFQAGAFNFSAGTLTNYVSSLDTTISPANVWGVAGVHWTLYMRLIWKSANTWVGAFSNDGVGWYDFAMPDQSFTMTPTHYGFCVSSRTNTATQAATFDYLRVYDSDLSV